MVTVDEYIDQLLAEMQTQESLHDVVQNIMNEPIPEAVKRRLIKSLLPGKYRPPQKRKERKRKAIREEFDLIPRSKTPRMTQDYQKEILEVFKQERPDPVPKGKQFIDLDDQVPPMVQHPTDKWVETLNDAKDMFEVDGAVAVFSTWRVKVEDPLDIGDIEIADGMHVRAGRLAFGRLHVGQESSTAAHSASGG